MPDWNRWWRRRPVSEQLSKNFHWENRSSLVDRYFQKIGGGVKLLTSSIVKPNQRCNLKRLSTSFLGLTVIPNPAPVPWFLLRRFSLSKEDFSGFRDLLTDEGDRTNVYDQTSKLSLVSPLREVEISLFVTCGVYYSSSLQVKRSCLSNGAFASEI